MRDRTAESRRIVAAVKEMIGLLWGGRNLKWRWTRCRAEYWPLVTGQLELMYDHRCWVFWSSYSLFLAASGRLISTAIVCGMSSSLEKMEGSATWSYTNVSGSYLVNRVLCSLEHCESIACCELELNSSRPGIFKPLTYLFLFVSRAMRALKSAPRSLYTIWILWKSAAVHTTKKFPPSGLLASLFFALWHGSGRWLSSIALYLYAHVENSLPPYRREYLKGVRLYSGRSHISTMRLGEIFGNEASKNRTKYVYYRSILATDDVRSNYILSALYITALNASTVENLWI